LPDTDLIPRTTTTTTTTIASTIVSSIKNRRKIHHRTTTSTPHRNYDSQGSWYENRRREYSNRDINTNRGSHNDKNKILNKKNSPKQKFSERKNQGSNVARKSNRDETNKSKIDTEGNTKITDSQNSECGENCRNRLHHLDHPKEHDRCQPGQVIDIWGYCRYIFQMERRDWSWWENIRHYVHSMGNSWYNSYQPTIHQQMYENHIG